MSTLGEQLPRLLEALDIDTVFGIPGVHTTELYRGLADTRLRHVTPRHEQGAGFMADGYARVSGRPAACFIISGPGMTNIATAMGQAYADSVPMLVISSVLGRSALGRGEGRLHELKDQRALVDGVAAFSHTVLTAADLPAALDRAMACFRSGRPRPVHLELPLDVILDAAPDVEPRPPSTAIRATADPKALDAAAAFLDAARSPLVVLGGGCVASAPDVRQLVERLGAPAVSTINAKGILPRGHPLLVGSLLPQAPLLEALRDAEVVLAIGTELGETDTLLFGDRPEIAGRLIRVDIDADQLTRNAYATLGIVSDAGSFCRGLTERLDRPAVTQHERASALRRAGLESLDTTYRAHGRLLDALADRWPDLVIVGDSTQPVYGGNQSYDAPGPRQWFNSSTGFGTLGYALPAAIGARLARPDATVVALIGDGGLQFTIAELSTAVELGLPLPVILWNNRGYAEIKHHMRERGVREIGVDIHTPDFQALARGFGAHATQVQSLPAMLAAVATALTAVRPTIIEIDEARAAEW